jgi:hypothetical protein
MKELVDRLVGLLSDPSAFWLVFGTILFCAFLLLVAFIESVILKKSLNAFVLGILFALFVYFGIQWGKGVAPTGAGYAWKFGVPPVGENLCPTDSPIKAALHQADTVRCFYYSPGSDNYNQVKANRCYARVDEARGDGCERPSF